MLDSLITRRHDRARLRNGPLYQRLEQFAEVLLGEGYRPSTVRRYVFAAHAFGRWLGHQRLTVHDLDAGTLSRYLEGLGRQRCHQRLRGRLPTAGSGVHKFLRFLRQSGVVSPAPRETIRTEADRWLAEFDHHLDHVVGLSPGTRHMYLRYARRLVETRFGTVALDWSALSADDVTEFVRCQAERLKPSSRRLPGTATRALLRFLGMKGAVNAGLVGAVPPVRQWKQASLPHHLSTDEVERLLAATDQAQDGRRDRAIIVMLLHLGLRAGEIAGLTLDDIDWTEGRVCIRASKSGRDRSLPLVEDVGDALVTYLQARPSAVWRNVFLSAVPPYRPLRPSSVSAMVDETGRRAGIEGCRRGAHALRHTVATRMVRCGASFKEVADVLGHALLETTAIYAKLDIEALAAVALPWPGGVR
jgi:site-specific recombinase XerD